MNAKIEALHGRNLPRQWGAAIVPLGIFPCLRPILSFPGGRCRISVTKSDSAGTARFSAASTGLSGVISRRIARIHPDPQTGGVMSLAHTVVALLLVAVDAVRGAVHAVDATAEAIHDRAVSEHDVSQRRLVFRGRVAASCFRRTRPVSGMPTPIPVGGGTWTPVTSSTTDSTYGVSFFPTRRPHPDHAGSGWQRAEPPLCADAGRRGAGSDPRRQAEGELHAVGARRLRVLRADERTRRRRPSTSTGTTAKTYARTLFYREQGGVLPGAGFG